MKKNAIRWSWFLVGIRVMSLGIALVTRADLGTTPISALPLVTSHISGLTFGTTTLIINCLMILTQWVLLRKETKWTLILQVPVTFIFSFFIDFWMQHTLFLASDAYYKCLMLNMLGNVVLSLGVTLEILANVIVLPGEGVVVAAAYFFKKPFPRMKTFNDVSLVILAVLCSFVFLGGLEGLREGTILSALTVGFFVKLWLSGFHRLTGRRTQDEN